MQVPVVAAFQAVASVTRIRAVRLDLTRAELTASERCDRLRDLTLALKARLQTCNVAPDAPAYSAGAATYRRVVRHPSA